MARKRKTDHDSAVAAALNLFWKRGYDGASTREIEKMTGLTRFTLQTTYGGKEGFFLDTLDAYLDHAEAHHFPDPETFDLEALAVWFEQLVEPDRIPDIDESGCLAFNSISEFERGNVDINERIQRYLNSFESRVLEILRNESERGNLLNGIGVEQLAHILVDLLLGIHAVIKSRSDNALPMVHAKSVAELIRSWKNVPRSSIGIK